MNRKTRMIIFAVIGVAMTIGLFVFAPAPESNKSAAVPAAGAEQVAESVEKSVDVPSQVSSEAFKSVDDPEPPVETDPYALLSEEVPADDVLLSEEAPGGYLARIQMNAPEQVEAALRRAQLLYESGEIRPGDKPLTFVLHGPEVSIFFKENYAANQRLVDLAAKLSAFKVVDMKVCATRLGALGETKQSLAPFVSTIPFGPAEVSRLLDEENFIYF